MRFRKFLAFFSPELNIPLLAVCWRGPACTHCFALLCRVCGCCCCCRCCCHQCRLSSSSRQNKHLSDRKLLRNILNNADCALLCAYAGVCCHSEKFFATDPIAWRYESIAFYWLNCLHSIYQYIRIYQCMHSISTSHIYSHTQTNGRFNEYSGVAGDCVYTIRMQCRCIWVRCVYSVFIFSIAWHRVD